MLLYLTVPWHTQNDASLGALRWAWPIISVYLFGGAHIQSCQK